MFPVARDAGQHRGTDTIGRREVDDFGAELGRLQRERGLSLHELARRSYYNVGYLSKVVRGLKGGSRELALRMDKALGAGGVLIDAWDRSALTAAPPVPDEAGDNEDVQRRDFLAASAGLAGLLTVPPQLGHLAAGRNIGSEMPDLLRQRLSRLRRLDDYLGGTDTYRVYLAELQATQALAAQAACTGTTRVELVRLISEQAQQAGWAAFDAGWQAAATALYKESLTSARTAEDRPLEGNALALLAYQNLTTGRPAASLAEASCQAAGKTAPPRVRALLNERRAWVITNQTGRAETPARRALDTAAAALDDDRAAPSPDWASWADQTELQIMTGRCLTRHRPEQAIPVLETVLGGFDDRRARDKALYLSWLAEACLATGDLERASAVTEQVIDLANGVASVRPVQRVAFLLRGLSARSSAPYVTELADRATWITPTTWRE